MAYNKIILEGHLTRDIEIRYTNSGTAVAQSSIAVSSKFKKQDGTQGEKTLFLEVVAFARLGEIMNQFLRKGSHVLLDGSLELDMWTKQDGSKGQKHKMQVREMQMLGNKGDAPAVVPDNGAPAPAQQSHYADVASTANKQTAAAQLPEIDIKEDELPF